MLSAGLNLIAGEKASLVYYYIHNEHRDVVQLYDGKIMEKTQLPVY